MPELDASLTRPKLDATLVLTQRTDEIKSTQQQCPLFALASLNTKTASSAEVRWSQLLALSLAPEDEPVISVGRHRDCSVRLADPRASLWHFEIRAKRKSGQAYELKTLEYECSLHDRSSNGTAVNGSIVGKGNVRLLRTGDDICVLPANRVGQEETISFLFRNTTESLAAPEQVRSLDLDELMLCPICMQAIYKCVALTPCCHNFCMACFSEWMRRKSECPVCRQPITVVMKNHLMDSVVEAFLEANPKWLRPPEELREMDARDELRLGATGKLVREMCSIDISASRAQASVVYSGAQAITGGTISRPAAQATPASQAAPASQPTPTAAPAPSTTGTTSEPAATGSGSAASSSQTRTGTNARLGSQVCEVQ